MISVDVNGVTEVVRLEDLADGESRTFDVGDHELVVKRVGDDLTIINDGHGFGSFGEHGTRVWVTDEGENIEIDGDCEFGENKVIVMKVDGLEGEDGEAMTYTIHVDGDDVLLDGEHNIEIDEIVKLHGGHHGAVFISEDGDVDHPMIIKSHGMHAGMVKYLCEETGSVLMVKQEDALEDAYICPATGCVMKKLDRAGSAGHQDPEDGRDRRVTIRFANRGETLGPGCCRALRFEGLGAEAAAWTAAASAATPGVEDAGAGLQPAHEVIVSATSVDADAAIGNGRGVLSAPAFWAVGTLWRPNGPASHHRRGRTWLDWEARTTPMVRRRPSSGPGQPV